MQNDSEAKIRNNIESQVYDMIASAAPTWLAWLRTKDLTKLQPKLRTLYCKIDELLCKKANPGEALAVLLELVIDIITEVKVKEHEQAGNAGRVM